jgi:cell division septation protein DedD
MMRAKTVLVKLEMCVLAWMLGACTAVPDATQQADNLGAQERNNADLEEELRARLNALRDNPSQASPELIRDLQEVLKALREQQVAQPGAKPAAARQAKAVVAQPPAKPTPAKAQPAKPKPIDAEPPGGVRPDTIYASAMQAEQQDRPLQAVALYRHASRLGHATATKRLMEIYTEGLPGISRNYVAAVKFKHLALQQGADIDEKYAQ